MLPLEPVKVFLGMEVVGEDVRSLDTGAAHDHRRDSVTIAFGRTREKERKSKPSELCRVEWRERGSRCLWCVGAAQDES